MTDTIGWGEVDERPSRLPRLRLSRRRRIALTVAAALVAGGIVAWPPFRSWRADGAARVVQHIWERAQGYDDERIDTLMAAERALGPFDRSPFARAVASIDREEAAAFDRLIRQAKAIRTWTSDVGAARDAVVTALRAQQAGLRGQAGRPAAITIDEVLTTSIDDRSLSAADIATAKVEALRKRHHLKVFTPTTERFHSATTILAMLARPTDEALHLRLVTSGVQGVTVTDLDTGKEIARRTIDVGDPETWQPERLFGPAVVGSIENGIAIIPFAHDGKERKIAGHYLQSSTGSPMWVSAIDTRTLRAIDGSGRVLRTTARPDGIDLIGGGTGTALLATDLSQGSFFAPSPQQRHYVFDPDNGRRTPLAVTGCPQQPVISGTVVVVATGDLCDYANKVEVFDVSGRLLRTVPVPGNDVTAFLPICSPDGKYVALPTTPRPANFDESSPTRLRVLDTTTGTWTTVPASNGWTPLGWSSDSRTLLLQLTDNGSLGLGPEFGPLAYLRVGQKTLHSIRLRADQWNFLT
ncbi:MAG: hypothetical protein QOC82_605 [Frankiaceae bacterium]|nr:hypothetical protein [Frankiaceae bacterium]